jgi:hypothetical protein
MSVKEREIGQEPNIYTRRKSGHCGKCSTHTWALIVVSMRALMTRVGAQDLRMCKTMGLKVLESAGC